MTPATRKSTLAAVMAMSCGVALAQTSNQALFERAIDRLNCEAVAWSMKDADDSKELRFKKECPCEDRLDHERLKECIRSVDKTLGGTITLVDRINELKRSFKKEWSSTDARDFLEHVFMGSAAHPSLHEFASKPTAQGTPRRDDKKFKDIISAAADELRGWTPAHDSDVPDPVPRAKEAGRGGSVWPMLLIGLASMLGSIAVTVLLLRQSAPRHAIAGRGGRIPDDIKNYVKEKIENARGHGVWEPSNRPAPRPDKELARLDERVSRLEEKTKRLEAMVSTPPPTMVTTEWTIESSPKHDVVFFPGPDDQGSFNESFASPNYKEGASVYRFTKHGSDRASFVVHDHPGAIRMALEYHERYIRPACEASNAFDRNASRIVTERSGEARLEGGKWKTVSKAKIRYEP